MAVVIAALIAMVVAHRFATVSHSASGGTSGPLASKGPAPRTPALGTPDNKQPAIGHACGAKVSDVLLQCGGATGGCGDKLLAEKVVQYGECKALAAKDVSVCRQVLSDPLAISCSKNAAIDLISLELGTPNAVAACKAFFAALPPMDRMRYMADNHDFCPDFTAALFSRDADKICAVKRKYINPKDDCADISLIIKEGDCTSLDPKNRDSCGFFDSMIGKHSARGSDSWQLRAYSSGEGECAKMEPDLLSGYCKNVENGTAVYSRVDLMPTATMSLALDAKPGKTAAIVAPSGAVPAAQSKPQKKARNGK